MLSQKEIIVYTGAGTTESIDSKSTSATVTGLQSVLSNYEIKPSSQVKEIRKKLLNGKVLGIVVPGGKGSVILDQFRSVNLEQAVSQFVKAGGLYLGICAGAYISCGAIAFIPHKLELQKFSSDTLKLLPGVLAVGPVFNARTFRVFFKPEDIRLRQLVKVYQGQNNFDLPYSGGSTFNWDQTNHGKITRFAEYHYYNKSVPAVIGKKVGAGTVILSGVHFEIAANQHSQDTGNKLDWEKYEFNRARFIRDIFKFTRLSKAA